MVLEAGKESHREYFELIFPMSTRAPNPLHTEFDRQVATLLEKGYPAAAGLGQRAFMNRVEALRHHLPPAKRHNAGCIDFVIVVKLERLRASDPIGLQALKGTSKANFFEPAELAEFKPIAGVAIPAGLAYLLLDVDTGENTLNVTPDEALARMLKRQRSPLTIDEGLAVLTHFPNILKTSNAFSMLASRRGDRRVPALWTSNRRPKLGWCWAGNPHTWLGSASCGGRAGATVK